MNAKKHGFLINFSYDGKCVSKTEHDLKKT